MGAGHSSLEEELAEERRKIEVLQKDTQEKLAVFERIRKEQQNKYDEDMKELQQRHSRKWDAVVKEQKAVIKSMEMQLETMKEENKQVTKQELQKRHYFLVSAEAECKKNLEDLKKEFSVIERNFSEMSNKYYQEETRMSHIKIEREDPNVLRVILYSPTGCGKSTLGNRLCGDTSQLGDKGVFAVGHGITSETDKIKKQIIRNYRHTISIIDQPGVADSRGALEDEKHANELVTYLRGITFVNAIIILKKNIKIQELTVVIKKCCKIYKQCWAKKCGNMLLL